MENSFSDFGIGKRQAQIGKSINSSVQNLSKDAQPKVSSSEVIDVKAKKPITVQDLIDKGLTPEQAQKCIDENPSISNLSTDAVNSLVQKYKESPIPAPTVETVFQETPNPKSSTGTGVSYDFKSFKDIKDPGKKSELLVDEYAKNMYKEDWDNFSDEVKEQKKSEIVTKFLQRYTGDEDFDVEKLKQLLDSPDFKNKYNNLSKKEKMVINSVMNSKMLDIQVANRFGITVEELSSFANKEIRNGVRYDLMKEIIAGDTSKLRENFSIDDVETFQEMSMAIEELKKRDPRVDDSGTKFGAVMLEWNKTHSKDQQINTYSLAFDYLNDKMQLSGEQRETFNSVLFKTDKLQGFQFKKFLSLLNKTNLTPDEQKRFDQLVKESGLKDEEIISLRELCQKSGFNNVEVDVYRDLAVKDVVSGHKLNRFAEADTGNIIMKEIYASPVYAEAMKKYRSQDEYKDKAYDLAIKDWLVAQFPEGLTEEEFQERLETILNKANGRTQILIMSQVKETGILGRYKNFKPTKTIGYAGINVLSAEQINKMEPGEDRTIIRNASANYSSITGDYERANEFNRTDGDINLEYQRQLVSKYGDKDGYVENVVNDFPKNADKYCKAAQENIIKTGGSGLEDLMNDEQLNDYANSLGNYVSNSGDQDLKDLYAASRDTYTGKAYDTVNTRASELGYQCDVNNGNNNSNPSNNISQVDVIADQIVDLISEVKQGNVAISQIEDLLAPLSYGEQVEVLNAMNPADRVKLPLKLCEKYSTLIEDFVNAGKGLEIVINCDVPTGNRAIALMMKKPDERKDLAAVRPERFAKNTYDELVASNIIKEPGNKDDIEPKEYLG